MTDMAFAQRSLAEAVSDEAFYRSQINNAPVTVGEMTPENRLKILDLQIAEYSAKGFTAKHLGQTTQRAIRTQSYQQVTALCLLMPLLIGLAAAKSENPQEKYA